MTIDGQLAERDQEQKMRWRPAPVSGLAAASIVFAGPALVILARSDLGRWSSFAEKLLLSAPVGILASIVFSYALVTLLFDSTRTPSQIVIGVVGSPVIPFLSYFAAIPLFFGFGESGAHVASGILFVVLILPTALFQAFAVADRESRSYVFGACVIAAAVSLGVTAWGPLVDSNTPRPPEPYGTRIFDGAAYLLAAIPHAILAYMKAKPSRPSRLVVALVLALAPVYALKALAEIRTGNFARAIAWPGYVFTDFVSWSDRVEAAKKLDERLRNGLPTQIGEHWYRFENVLNTNLSPYGLSRDPRRIEFLQIVVGASTIGVENVLSPGQHAILSVVTWQRLSTQASHLLVVERYEDLAIYMLFARGEKFDPEEVRVRLKHFLSEARTSPPT